MKSTSPTLITLLIKAGAISYVTDIKNVHVMNYRVLHRHWRAIIKVCNTAPSMPQPFNLSGVTVLVIDDDVDTDGTLDLVRQSRKDYVKEIRYPVIYKKSRSIVGVQIHLGNTDL